MPHDGADLLPLAPLAPTAPTAPLACVVPAIVSQSAPAL